MVGPDYRTPDAPTADRWLEDARPDEPSAGHVAQPPPDWWGAFKDPVLDAIVTEAVSQNLTLRTAGLRVIQARAARGIAVGQFFPQTQTIGAGLSNNQFSNNTPEGMQDNAYARGSVALEAVWELDFWGKYRRGIESADAALQASVAAYDAVLVSIAAEAATNYILIRTAQERLRYARENVKLQQDTLTLTQVRFTAGAVSELDVATARATLAQTRALIPQFEEALRSATVALCLVLGRPPSDLAGMLGDGAAIPAPPASIALGVPADLLRRRPDVRRAERIAAAASAQIGVAKSVLYPSISVTGATGFASTNIDLSGENPSLGNIFDSSSFQGFIGLSISYPILNYGRIKSNVRVADAAYEEAVTAYKQSVLAAAADVETSLSSFLRAREREAFLAEAVSAGERSVELSLIQYRNGASDFIRVNQTQTDLVVQQDALVTTRAQAALGAVSTFRALGGGWESRAGREFVPESTIREMRERTDWGDVISPDYQQGKDVLMDRPSDGRPEPLSPVTPPPDFMNPFSPQPR
ncbi:MAG: efflux transporter outer membrane subunit [Phycisphaerae bacterium]|nr:efflux transporter outer membrane subunit [Phycisphaerae bacterium]